ncbi:hypothetical protein [Parvibaculum sp.]|uniref:hypothetical protein n=1 Tax=Parvibaculum sp. TaxID=2024848 RepID=UPI00320C3AB4
MNDEGGSTRDGHGGSPSGRYFFFGRLIGADPAFVVATLPRLGLCSTSVVVLGARLVAIAAFDLRLGMPCLTIAVSIIIDAHRQ